MVGPRRHRQRHASRQPGARRDRPRRDRDRGRDGAERRPGRPPLGERPGLAARRRRPLAARDERLAGVAPRRRDRAPARRACRDHRRLARPQPTARVRPVRRLPARPRGGRAAARLAGAAGSSSSRRATCASARSSGCRASRRRQPSSAARPRSRTPRRSCAARCFKGIDLDEPVDALVIGIPPTTPFMPRERPNPVSAAYLGLGLALRLWRNRPPIVPGGTAILVHPFQRRFPRPTQTALPRALLRPEDGGRHRRDARRGSRRDQRRPRDRGLSRGARLPPAAAVRRVERVRRLRPPSRSGAGRRAAATRTPPGSSASCPCTGSARRSRWRAAAVRSASATCWRRRTSRSWSPRPTGHPTQPTNRTRSVRDVETVIETRALTKRFGDRAAVDGVDLVVGAGVAFGFLGPNGAGKTTMIRTLLGLTKRDLRRGQPARPAAAGEAPRGARPRRRDRRGAALSPPPDRPREPEDRRRRP